jgi:hypothetical protein
MKKFEYKFEVNIGEPSKIQDDPRDEEELNLLGSEGWELVAVSRCGKDFSWLGYWFKREIGSK